jgi:hypothetical protein
LKKSLEKVAWNLDAMMVPTKNEMGLVVKADFVGHPQRGDARRAC